MIIAMQAHSRLILLAEGINALGKDRVIFLDEEHLTHRDADLHVFYGHRAAEAAGFPEPFIILDRGFVRNPSLTIQVGGEWGALAFYPDLPMRRVSIPEWRYTDEKKALIIGQEPNDYSTRNAVQNYNKWLRDTKAELEGAGFEVRVREHPRNLVEAPRDVPRPPPLAEDLWDIGLVVGINSGALVECFLKGYPVHAADEHSWVYEFNAKLTEPHQDEPEGRQGLFDRLGGISWTYPELQDGRAWEAVRDFVLVPPTLEAQPKKPPTRTARKASRKKAGKSQKSSQAGGSQSGSQAA